jgi:O-antigen/teichoic acid export membrane protein
VEDFERDAGELDDIADRQELRSRYELLLQEVRVSLPGVQILLAFLLTAPFSPRFGDVDSWGRLAYGIALASSLVSVVCLLTPTVLHRLGERTARAERLVWSIRLEVAGLLAVAVALVAATWGVSRYVFNSAVGWIVTGGAVALILVCWVVLPRRLRRRWHTKRADT